MNHKIVRWAGAACVLFGLPATCLAQSLTTADPEGAGFSPARLERIVSWHRLDSGARILALVAIAERP